MNESFMKKELATALGISAAMVTKLSQRGMPVDSVEAAKDWRRRNLSPLHTKEFRMGGNDGGGSKPSQNDQLLEVAAADQRMVAQHLFPAIFRAQSPLTELLLGHLQKERGLSFDDAIATYELAALGFVMAANEFFGHENCFDGGGLEFELPDLLELRMHSRMADKAADEGAPS